MSGFDLAGKTISGVWFLHGEDTGPSDWEGIAISFEFDDGTELELTGQWAAPEGGGYIEATFSTPPKASDAA